jgi:hypothetical protein
MSASRPGLDDYLALFGPYGDDLGALYQAPEDDRYRLLFEQAMRLLARPSPFNLSLPEPLRAAAVRWRAADPGTRSHFDYPVNRHFLLADLHDLIMLKGGLGRRRAKGS